MQATTPLDPRVLDAMLPYLTEQYGNPHSRTHMYGWESEDAVEAARKQVCPAGGLTRRAACAVHGREIVSLPLLLSELSAASSFIISLV